MLKIARFMIGEDPVCRTHSYMSTLAVTYDLKPAEVRADVYTHPAQYTCTLLMPQAACRFTPSAFLRFGLVSRPL